MSQKYSIIKLSPQKWEKESFCFIQPDIALSGKHSEFFHQLFLEESVKRKNADPAPNSREETGRVISSLLIYLRMRPSVRGDLRQRLQLMPTQLFTV